MFAYLNGKFIVISQADSVELSPLCTMLSPFLLLCFLPVLSSCPSKTAWFYPITVNVGLRGLDFARLQSGFWPAGGAVSSSSCFLG